MYTPSIEKIATIKFIILSSTKIAQYGAKIPTRGDFFFLNSRSLSSSLSFPLPVSASQFSRIVEKQSRGRPVPPQWCVHTDELKRLVAPTFTWIWRCASLSQRKGRAFNIRHSFNNGPLTQMRRTVSRFTSFFPAFALRLCLSASFRGRNLACVCAPPRVKSVFPRIS